MFNFEEQAKLFKDHIATFTDYGDIKILDFKKPNSSEYRIRFLFEEDYCKLHISGDLGELIATNYSNMTYDKFSDFTNDIGCFEGKINCHNRALYRYDDEKARKFLKQLIEENDLADEFDDCCSIDNFLDDVFDDFDDERGLDSRGYGKLAEIIPDVWEFASTLGREETGILQLYMLAFKLATVQIAEKRADNG